MYIHFLQAKQSLDKAFIKLFQYAVVLEWSKVGRFLIGPVLELELELEWFIFHRKYGHLHLRKIICHLG